MSCATKTLLVVLCAAAVTQGCSSIGKLHTQAGVMVGHNFGEEGQRDFGDTQAVAELGYVTGESRRDYPSWDFGGAGYLIFSDPMRPGIKAIARRRFNHDIDLDISAGPMITYDSSSSFSGFIGGVALNVKFLTLRSEYMTWPVEAWDETRYADGIPIEVIHHAGGHEKIWFNGVSMNGNAGWAVIGAATALIIIGIATGGITD